MAADHTAAEPRPETQDELHRLREENLRFRDLLIAKDAELGALKGQVAALEAGTARVLRLIDTIKGLLPGRVLWALKGVARRLAR